MASVAPSPPTRPIAAGVVLVIALLAWGAWVTARSYTDLQALVADELELRELSGRLLYLQEQRAMSARLAVETGAPEWEVRYRRLQPEFDDVLRRAVAAAPPGAAIGSPTWTASAALAAAETGALTLLRQERRADARMLLAAPEYLQRQADYVRGLETMSAQMVAQAQAHLAAERMGMLAAAVLGLGLLAALAAVWVWIARLVQEYLRKIEAAETALERVNRGLEDRVRERTAELSAVNRQLREEMERRSKMELELRQAQKLEAVGRLAAGVAHEINTPVQFVADSCHYLDEAVTGTLALLAQHRQLLDAVADGRMSAAAARNELVAVRRAADADDLAEHMPQAVSRAREGLERIAQIVRSMKEFSHPGGRGRVRTDLNRAIASTLTIARNEYRYVADVHTEFGELPPVYCFPGELNQAILNLIVNATHAIQEVVDGTGRRGTITVRTRLEGAQVAIEVQDDGSGIPPQIRERIFEPFFTTKEVGRGTGQGLAIVRAVVVDKHGGRLTVDSDVGRGTTFTIRIPVAAPAGTVEDIHAA